MDLREILSDEDKRLMTSYIKTYAGFIYKDNDIDLHKYLSEWAKTKKTLYHLLGDSLTKEMSYTHEKSIDDMMFDIHAFQKKYKPLYAEIRQILVENNAFLTESDRVLTNYLLNSDCVYKNSSVVSFSFMNSEKKVIKIKSDEKLMKVIKKMLDAYVTDEYESLLNQFEQMRIEHSQLLNDKKTKGTVVLSIHPLDFMTMSDNNNKWTSCMSWKERGCYRVGTVEMMNSNNVLVAYIKSEKEQYQPYEGFTWNSKKWRQLFIVNKDIIVGGKAYPFYNKDTTFLILNFIKELADQNKDWHYEYGPELYLDMKNVSTDLDSMDRKREYLNSNFKHKKHFILFDTKGMYNDMVNDHNTDYWCYRNKVKNCKIVSYSGKVLCPCCGLNNVLQLSDYYDDYNDQFDNSEELICYACSDARECEWCSDDLTPGNSIIIGDSYFCKECASRHIAKCRKCNNHMYVNTSYVEEMPYLRMSNDNLVYEDVQNAANRNYYSVTDNHRLQVGAYVKDQENGIEHFRMPDESKVCVFEDMKIVPLCVCPTCSKTLYFTRNFTKQTLTARERNYWGYYKKQDVLLSNEVYTEEEVLKDDFLESLLFKHMESYI